MRCGVQTKFGTVYELIVNIFGQILHLSIKIVDAVYKRIYEFDVVLFKI